MTGYEVNMYEAIPRMARTLESINKSMQPKQIDWEQRRYEIAKDLLAASYDGGSYSVTEAVRIADKLIAALKKTQQ